MKKRCYRCNIEKDSQDYTKNKAKPDGLDIICRSCKKEHYDSDKQRHYRKNFKDRNPDSNKKYKEKYKGRYHYEYDPIKSKEYREKIRNTDKEAYRKKEREKRAKRRSNNPLYKIRSNIGTLICNVIANNGYTKRSKTSVILGCTFDEFYNHIEKQFLPNMNWDNRSEWHLDHIVPISFGESEEEILLLNHYSNFRPLWAKDNIMKSNALTEESIKHPIYKTIMDNRKK